MKTPLKTPFNKTKKYCDGKKRILRRVMLREKEKKDKEEKILKLFKESAHNNEDFINPEMMEDKDVLNILKKNKRNFGILKTPNSRHFKLNSEPLTTKNFSDLNKNFGLESPYLSPKNCLQYFSINSLNREKPGIHSLRSSEEYLYSMNNKLKKYSNESTFEVEKIKFRLDKFLHKNNLKK